MPFEHASNPRVEPVGAPDPEVAEMLAKTMASSDGNPLAIFRTMARHPRMMKRFNVLGGFFLGRGELPARDRELVILYTAWRCNCEYEWAQHVLIGRDAGLTDAEIGRVPEPDAERTPLDTLLFRATDEILDSVDVSDPTWAGLRSYYSEEQLVELVTLVGFYRMTAGFLNAAGVEREAELPGWPGAATTAENSS